MGGEHLSAFALRQVTAYPGSPGGAFDQARDLLIPKPLGAYSFPLARNAPEQWSMGYTRQLQPDL